MGERVALSSATFLQLVSLSFMEVLCKFVLLIHRHQVQPKHAIQ